MQKTQNVHLSKKDKGKKAPLPTSVFCIHLWGSSLFYTHLGSLKDSDLSPD